MPRLLGDPSPCATETLCAGRSNRRETNYSIASSFHHHRVGSSLPWQDPKTVGPNAGADARLLLEQQVKIALLSQKQEEIMDQLSVLLSLEHRVHQMENRQLDDGGLQLLDRWDVVQLQKFAT